MENRRLFITIGKLAGDVVNNAHTCIWQGQKKRSCMDFLMTEPNLKISILNAKSQVIGFADDVKCARERGVNEPPLFTFKIVLKKRPHIVNHTPIGLGPEVRHRFRKELLHKYGYRLVCGNICDGIFLCSKIKNYDQITNVE